MRDNRLPLIISGVIILASLAFLTFFIINGVKKPQNAAPSKAAEGDLTDCQGNTIASAKCFDCKKDTGTDQVNILDFSCFAKFYGQNVGLE